MRFSEVILPAILLLSGVAAQNLEPRGVETKTIWKVLVETKVVYATVLIGKDHKPVTTIQPSGYVPTTRSTQSASPSTRSTPYSTSLPSSTKRPPTPSSASSASYSAPPASSSKPSVSSKSSTRISVQVPGSYPTTSGFTFQSIPWEPLTTSSSSAPSQTKAVNTEPVSADSAQSSSSKVANKPSPTTLQLSTKSRFTSSHTVTATSTSKPQSTSGTSPKKSVLQGRGLSYSPYTHAGNCKTAQEIEADIKAIQGKGYSYIRLYGTDCDQTNLVIPTAAKHGLKTFAAVYFLSSGYGNSFDNEIKSLVTFGKKNGWDEIIAVGVGNEDLNTGRNSGSVVLARLKDARNALRSAGYNGPVVHVDTVNGFQQLPEACKESDFVAANVHPFFGGVPSENSGSFLQDEIKLLQKICGRDDIVITETGWPHRGEVNKYAIPSPAEQKKALDSMREMFSSDIVLFSAFDDAWKKNDATTYGSEQFWGIMSH